MEIRRSSPEQDESGSQESAVLYEQSVELASRLVAKYREQMYDHPFDPTYGGIPFKMPRDYLKLVPEDILNQYQAHGNKHEHSVVDQLADTLNILSNSQIKGWWAPLSAKGGSAASEYAYITEIMVVLDKDNPEPGKRYTGEGIENDETRPMPSSKPNHGNVNIQAVIFCEKFYPMLPEIQALYPNVKILRADQIPEYFQGDKGTLEEHKK